MKTKQELLEIIKKQRATKKKEKFSGTFLDYLEKVSLEPSIVKLAHKRLNDFLRIF